MKIKKLIFNVFGMLLVGIPAINLEAFSSVGLSNAINCHTLASSYENELNHKQKQQAAHCDSTEADHAWQDQYGHLNSKDISAGIVYEPSLY